MTRKAAFSVFIAVALLGLFFRLWNISFGLPHSFYADEPEVAEPAIKYTYEFRNIISDNNYYKLIPVSYVYGTFPTYLMTASTMFFSKFLNTVNLAFDKSTLYVNMRVLTAIISLLTAFVAGIIYKQLFKDNLGFIITFALTALNWKLIVHAHYVNNDITLTLLLLLSFVFLFRAYINNFDTKNTALSAIFFGLAVGTKFTALISLPMFAYLFLQKKDIKAMAGFLSTSLAVFIITNPFSIVFFKDFSFRIFEMFFKEGGLVFDSADPNPFKYVSALAVMLGAPALLSAFYGIIKSEKLSASKNIHIFLLGNIVIYFLFYSLQSRRVDRWLLPIIPLLLLYASVGIIKIYNKLPKRVFFILAAVFTLFYLYNPALLLTQFQQDTPKSAAYKWIKNNLPLRKSVRPYILVYTEEGLDPINKVGQAKVIKVNVYESENAQLFYPENPFLYEYVVISSRPMSNYKRTEVVKKYPDLTNRWDEFENVLQNSGDFLLIKDFSLSKPNLIPLSDVYIYKNLKFQNEFLATEKISN